MVTAGPPSSYVLLAVAVLGQDGSGRLRVVRTGRDADLAVGGGAGDAVLQVHGQLAGVVLGVPTVAEQDVRDAGVGEQLLGGLVLLRKQQCRAVCLGDARVGDEADAGVLRGLNGVGVLRGALSDLAGGDQQDFLGAGEGLAQRGGIVRIGAADDDALGSEVVKRLGTAAGRHAARPRTTGTR
jgi:hypothetical protein